MDSHVFRIIAGELVSLLRGARVEKIYGPVPGVSVFTLFVRKAKRRLLLRRERQSPLLFFTSRRLSNPERPPAIVMRLRKYCAGRRLGQGVIDFPSRRIAFPVAASSSREHGVDRNGNSAGDRKTVWLMLDLRAGAEVVFSLPQGFGDDPIWPETGIVDSLCGKPWNKRETQGPWQEYAVLTPFLRETLAVLDPMEGRALLVDLEAGGGDLFAYADAAGRLTLYSAWPLPDAVCSGRGFTPSACPPVESPEYASDNGSASANEFQKSFPFLALVSLVDEARFYAEFGKQIQNEERRPKRKEDKRMAKLLAKLNQEEKRLNSLVELRCDARALQEILWQYPPDARMESVSVPSGREGGATRTIALNPLLTLRENMARMFHSSARGTRGLEHLRQWREQVLAEHSGLWAHRRAVTETGDGSPGADPEEPGGYGGTIATGSGVAGPPAGGPGPAADGGRLQARYTLGKTGESKALRNVARFISSDGFTILRGKNAQGNQALLKLGQDHDYWLHALDGPSAHLIIRRSHPAEDIPERTLIEAAALVGEKSWQRHDSRAHVMVALLSHVHAIKAAPPGTVRVDAVLRTITATLEGERPQG